MSSQLYGVGSKVTVQSSVHVLGLDGALAVFRMAVGAGFNAEIRTLATVGSYLVIWSAMPLDS